MNLGNRHAGIRIERAKWGMPARLTVYAVRDPYAGQGTIPWRHYWARDLRWPLRVGRIVSPAGRTVGLHLDYGWGVKRRHHMAWFPWARP